MELEAIGFSLRECLGAALKAVALRAHQRGLELAADVADDAPERLIGDPSRIRQLLLNSSATRSVHREGRDRAAVRVGIETEHSVVLHLSVADTESGFRPRSRT